MQWCALCGAVSPSNYVEFKFKLGLKYLMHSYACKGCAAKIEKTMDVLFASLAARTQEKKRRAIIL